MEAISRFCGRAKKSKTLNQNSSAIKSVKELRSLELTICDAHKLPGKMLHQYCIVSLNDAKTCRTKAQDGQEPVWAEEFKFRLVQKSKVYTLENVYALLWRVSSIVRALNGKVCRNRAFWYTRQFGPSYPMLEIPFGGIFERGFRFHLF